MSSIILTKLQTLFRVPQFLHQSPFSVPGSGSEFHIACGCHISSVPSKLPHAFPDLETQLLCRLSLNLDLSCFLLIVSGRVVAKLDHLFKALSGGFLHCKVVFLFYLFHKYYFGDRYFEIMKICLFLNFSPLILTFVGKYHFLCS